MKLLPILSGVIGVLASASTGQEPEVDYLPPPAAEQPILVHDLTKNEDWDAVMDWAKQRSGLSDSPTDDEGEAMKQRFGAKLLVTFYAPWCSHCKRMIPNMLDASHHFQRWEQKDYVRFGRVDCTTAKKRCAKYGVYSYPTILMLDAKGGIVAEFPQGPRSSEAILSFVAQEMRPKMPLPIAVDDYEKVAQTMIRICLGPQPVNDRSYVSHFCQANMMHNHILADKTGVDKLLEVIPKINENHVIIQVPDGDTVGGVLDKSSSICWVDNIRPGLSNCVDTEAPDSEKLIRIAARKYANPMIVSSASWENFFQAARETPKMTVLMVGSPVYVSNYGEWYNEYQRVRNDDIRQDAVFLEATPAAPLAKVFEQVGANDRPMPWVGVWSGPLAKQEFFIFDGQKEEMLDWIHKVHRGDIEPFLRTEKGWWHNTKSEFVQFGQMVQRAWKNSPWHQKTLMGGAVTLIVGGLWAINHFLPSDEEEVVRIAQRSVRAQNVETEGETTGSEETMLDDTSKAADKGTVRQRK